MSTELQDMGAKMVTLWRVVKRSNQTGVTRAWLSGPHGIALEAPVTPNVKLVDPRVVETLESAARAINSFASLTEQNERLLVALDEAHEFATLFSRTANNQWSKRVTKWLKSCAALKSVMP